jgi:hypothetical protein
MTDVAPAPRRIRPDSAWDAARDDYLAGATAEEACRRHDLGLSAFWTRARRQGWRRADQPAPDPADEPLDFDAPADSRAQALDKAWRRVSRALDAGRSAEAMRWMRVHAMILQAERAEVREDERQGAQQMAAATRIARGLEAQTAATLRRMQAEFPHLHAEANRVQSKNPPAPLDPDAPGLNRAERRRRRKLAG